MYFELEFSISLVTLLLQLLQLWPLEAGSLGSGPFHALVVRSAFWALQAAPGGLVWYVPFLSWNLAFLSGRLLCRKTTPDQGWVSNDLLPGRRQNTLQVVVPAVLEAEGRQPRRMDVSLGRQARCKPVSLGERLLREDVQEKCSFTAFLA